MEGAIRQATIELPFLCRCWGLEDIVRVDAVCEGPLLRRGRYSSRHSDVEVDFTTDVVALELIESRGRCSDVCLT